MTESNHCCFPKWWYPPNKIDDLGASHGFVPHPSLCPILFPGGTYQVIADLRMRSVSTNKNPSNQKRNYDRWIHSNLRFLASFLQFLSRVTNVTQDDMESPMEKEGLKHRSSNTAILWIPKDQPREIFVKELKPKDGTHTGGASHWVFHLLSDFKQLLPSSQNVRQKVSVAQRIEL